MTMSRPTGTGTGRRPRPCAGPDAAPTLFDVAGAGGCAVSRPLPGASARSRVVGESEPHDAILALDVETVVDADLLPPDWDADRFPKAAWHRVVTISFVEFGIHRDGRDRGEAYRIRTCRSGGEHGWEEARLLRAFWRFFEAGHYRIVTWNGRSFDLPVVLLRSMRHGICTPAWFRRGTRWAGYSHRYATEWHTDLMEVLADFGASARLTLDEASALVGAPGKLGEHGNNVAALMQAGEVGRVRDYCETDCLNLAILYIRWAYLSGRTGAEEHDEAVRGLIAYLEAERDARPHLGRFLDAWRHRGERQPALVVRPMAGA